MTDRTVDTPGSSPEFAVSLAELVEQVHLANTRLLEIKSFFIPFALISEPPYTFSIQAGFAWFRRPDGFSYAIRVEVAVGPDGHSDQPFWTCSAAYEVAYIVDNAARFGDDIAIGFGTTSGLMAAWPYLREIVQSTSVRSGLAPVVMDVMRLVAPDQDQQPATTDQ